MKSRAEASLGRSNRGLRLARSAWANVSSSGPIEDGRSQRVQSRRLTWEMGVASHSSPPGFNRMEARRSMAREERGKKGEEEEEEEVERNEEGKRERGKKESEEGTSGQVESRRWSGRVASSVEAEWSKAYNHGPPLSFSLFLSLSFSLSSVSSWKSIAGKRVKIHPCRERTWLRGGLARLEALERGRKSAGTGEKRETKRGREEEREREESWKRLRRRDLGETRFTYLGVVLPTLSGSPLLAETCLVCAIPRSWLLPRSNIAGR